MTEVDNAHRLAVARGGGVFGGVPHDGCARLHGEGAGGGAYGASDVADSEPVPAQEPDRARARAKLGRTLTVAKVVEGLTIGLAIIGIGIVLQLLTGCGFLQAHQDELGKITAGVACVIEKEEIDDESMNEACDKILGYLTPEQQADVRRRASKVVVAHAEKTRRAVKAPAPACEGK